MMNQLEELIENTEANEIKLHGTYKIVSNENNHFAVGKSCMKGLIPINRSDVVIEGSDAEIEAEIYDCDLRDKSLFFIQPEARNVEFRNLKIRVYLKNAVHTERLFALIYNTAYATKINNCLFEVYTDRQVNVAAVYNNGNHDTHMNTRADNFTVNNCNITILCKTEEYEKECTVYGIYNNLANSICVSDTYIYVANKGKGERQKAVGIYTNGRFGRFVNNNIKANGLHNLGFDKEEAYAEAFINDGLYSIISSNNIVSEWAGRSVGLKNSGDYAIVSGNKILSTHTICGRCIENTGNAVRITGNILTTTSRNARIVDLNALHCVIADNHLEVLMPPSECPSGCGIYATGDRCIGNIVHDNVIRNVKDSGIIMNEKNNIIQNNRLFDSGDAVALCAADETLIAKFDERNIKSY